MRNIIVSCFLLTCAAMSYAANPPCSSWGTQQPAGRSGSYVQQYPSQPQYQSQQPRGDVYAQPYAWSPYGTLNSQPLAYRAAPQQYPQSKLVPPYSQGCPNGCPNGNCPNCPNGNCPNGICPIGGLTATAQRIPAGTQFRPIGFSITPAASLRGSVAHRNGTVEDASVRINGGSGICFYYDDKDHFAYIVTAAHCLYGREGGNGKIYDNRNSQVAFPDGQTFTSRTLQCNTKTDVGILQIRTTGKVPCTWLASVPPQPGETIYKLGYPAANGCRLDVKAGRVLRNDSDGIVYSIYVSPGDSGGGLVNQRGQVVGVVTGYATDNRGNRLQPTFASGPGANEINAVVRTCLFGGIANKNTPPAQPPTVVYPPPPAPEPYPPVQPPSALLPQVVDNSGAINDLRIQVGTIRNDLETVRGNVTNLRGEVDLSKPAFEARLARIESNLDLKLSTLTDANNKAMEAKAANLQAVLDQKLPPIEQKVAGFNEALEKKASALQAVLDQKLAPIEQKTTGLVEGFNKKLEDKASALQAMLDTKITPVEQKLAVVDMMTNKLTDATVNAASAANSASTKVASLQSTLDSKLPAMEKQVVAVVDAKAAALQTTLDQKVADVHAKLDTNTASAAGSGTTYLATGATGLGAGALVLSLWAMMKKRYPVAGIADPFVIKGAAAVDVAVAKAQEVIHRVVVSAAPSAPIGDTTVVVKSPPTSPVGGQNVIVQPSSMIAVPVG